MIFSSIFYGILFASSGTLFYSALFFLTAIAEVAILIFIIRKFEKKARFLIFPAIFVAATLGFLWNSIGDEIERSLGFDYGVIEPINRLLGTHF